MIKIEINKEIHEIDVDPQKPVLWVLREDIGLSGTKFGCGRGLCGACTIHVNGDAVRSCVTPVGSVVGKSVATIEGITAQGGHALQQEWVRQNVMQCGYCQPGQLMTAVALLNKNPRPSEAEIRQGMSGNLCRCGTYSRIVKAIVSVVEDDAR